MRKVRKTPLLPKGSIPGIIGSALAIAFLVFITICPSNMIRTLYDELDPLLREAERQAHTGDWEGATKTAGAIADAVYDSQDVLTLIVDHMYVSNLMFHSEMVQKMAQLKDLPLMLEELSGVRNELETILQIETVSLYTLF